MIATNVETMSDVEQDIPPLFLYNNYDRIYAAHATTSDDEQRPHLKYRSHATHATASDVEQGPPLKLYRSYAPHDGDATEQFGIPLIRYLKKYRIDAAHATASDVEQGPPLTKYRSYVKNYRSHATHATASDVKDNNIKMVTDDEEKDNKAAKQSVQRGIFFRESLLKEGTAMPSLKLAGIRSHQYFIPRSIASKIPFSIDAISEIFSIPVDSAMYRVVKNSIDECKMPPNVDESKKCVMSAEDMIDYALSVLGANADLQVWSTHNWSGFGDRSSLIGKVRVVYDGRLTAKQHLTCHQVTFPYLLHHCHSVSDTRVYDMEILDAETKEKINQGAAVCHLDTTGWDPDHLSFAELQSAPGETEVCHWIAPSDMAWTAGHVAE